MDFPSYEKLFVLEVLVDSVYISNSSLSLDKSTKSSLRETCVTFQFLNHPPLLVCKEDFFKDSHGSSDTQLNFKNGKSCIFSMASSLIPMLPYKFDVKVTVARKVGQKTDMVVLGTSTISMGDSFAALMHSSVDEPDLPLQKTKSGTFDIYDQANRKIGYITAFLRLSCYGQLVVTQFQVGANQEAFMFRGTEPKQAVETPGDRSKAPKIEVDPNYERAKTPEGKTPTQLESNTGYGDRREVARYQSDVYGGGEDYPYTEQPPAPQEPEGNYKEIVAEIRGHSLHIRVPMRDKKANDNVLCKKQLVEEIEGPVCKYAPPLNLCDCDFPVPPEAIPRCGPL